MSSDSNSKKTGIARTLYEEARGEGDAGMSAVAEVIFNRIGHAGFSKPADAHAVVAQQGQFHGYKGDTAPSSPDGPAWKKCLELAEGLSASPPKSPGTTTEGAHYFQRASSLPPVGAGWKVTFTVKIGNHNFFKLSKA